MWPPKTIIDVPAPGSYNTHFSSYGLGWFLSDVKGYKQATHTGGLAGTVTQITLIPELKLGIVVLTNQQSGAAFSSITNTIKDRYLGMPYIDRVKENHDRVAANEAAAAKITRDIWKDIEAQRKISGTKPDLNNFMGTYTDKWFGYVTISIKNGKMRFDSKRSFLLTGEMFPYKGSTFIVKWDDRSMDADAFATFSLDSDGKPSGMKMKAISPLTDFSFDFHDLDFTKTGK